MPDMEKAGRRAREKSGDILNTPPTVSLSQAFMYFIEGWRKYFVFSGRSNRTVFWSFICFNLIMGGFVGVVVGTQGTAVYSFLSLFPAWAAAVRRLHDTGRTGLWTLVPAFLTFAAGFFMQMQKDAPAFFCSSLSFVFSVLLLLFLCMKSDGKNRYGNAAG